MKLHGYAIEHNGNVSLSSFDTNATTVAARKLVSLFNFEPSEFIDWADCEAHGYRVVPVVVDVRKTGAAIALDLKQSGLIGALSSDQHVN